MRNHVGRKNSAKTSRYPHFITTHKISHIFSHISLAKVQLTTDGLKAYLEAVEENFGAEIDFAQLIKMYGKSIDGEHRFQSTRLYEARLFPQRLKNHTVVPIQSLCLLLLRTIRSMLYQNACNLVSDILIA